MIIKNINSQIFKNARMKLTTWYMVFVLLLSGGFSLFVYHGFVTTTESALKRQEHATEIQRQKIERRFPRLKMHEDMLDEMIKERNYAFNTNFQQAKASFQHTLILINLVILTLTGILSYYFAGKTLKPISEVFKKQKQFVSDASHELKTPITAMKAELEVALRSKSITVKESRESLKNVLEETNKLSHLAQSLLKDDLYENGGDISFEKINLKEIIKKQLNDSKKSIDTKSVKLKVSLENLKINGNYEKIVELVKILFENAIKYVNKNGTIEINLKALKQYKILKIKNTGEIIEKEDLPYIFDRFYRAEKSRKSDGFGLGLSIAKKIIGQHNAKIEVASNKKEGTTFTIIFTK